MAAAQIVLTAFGLMFLLDAADKALHPRRFATSLAAYELLPEAVNGAAATVLAIVGFVVGAALLGHYEVAAAATAGSGVLLVFALGMAINLWRGRADLECGCGTAAGGQRLQWRLVLRNVVLAGALMAAAAAGGEVAAAGFFEVLPAAFGLVLVHLAVSAVWASGSQQQWRLGSM